MLGTATSHHQYRLGSRFLKTYFLDILSSIAHLLRTLFIFKLDEVLI